MAANSSFPGGDVNGPASATDGALAAYDGTSGKRIKAGSASGVYVSSIAGTANQVIASAATGDVTLSLPQSLGTSSTPAFLSATLGGARNLQTTSTDGALISNSTAALVGTTVQISPRTRWAGTGWDADDAVSRSVSFFAEVLPTTGNTVAGSWKLGYIDPVSAAITYPLTVSSGGNATLLGSLIVAGPVRFIGQGSSIIQIDDNSTHGYQISGATDGTAQFLARATGADTATVKANKFVMTQAGPTWAAGDKYVTIDSSGNLHISAIGPAS